MSEHIYTIRNKLEGIDGMLEGLQLGIETTKKEIQAILVLLEKMVYSGEGVREAEKLLDRAADLILEGSMKILDGAEEIIKARRKMG